MESQGLPFWPMFRRDVEGPTESNKFSVESVANVCIYKHVCVHIYIYIVFYLFIYLFILFISYTHGVE